MTDAIIDPFKTNEEQVNYLDYAKTKFQSADGNVDVEGLARGKYESDRFILQLQNELAEARAKADQGLAVKELLEQLKSNPPAGAEPTPPAQVPNPDDLSKLVKDTINQTAREQKEAANKNAVVAKLNAEWGSNVGSELGKRAQALGVSVARLEEIGKESPEGLFAMLGLNNPQHAPGSATVPTSKVVLPNGTVGDRTKSYYDNLYRQNPKLRYDPKTTAAEHRDAIRLGVAFFDN